ncbi:hypothetical protein ACFWQG_13160 [Rhodococcus sp. NPDC058532]|uniref:hypothetical protein n=1 Tax=Rhodococcus sp. NPDC058532 TaxID=3346540 RepID=UPI003656DFD1
MSAWDRFINDPEFMAYAILLALFAIGLIVSVCGLVNAVLDIAVPAAREWRQKAKEARNV